MPLCRDGLKAVIFDFDGTLAETRIDFARMRECIYSLIQDWGVWEEEMRERRYVLEVIATAAARLGPGSDRTTEFARQAEAVLVEVEMETVADAAPYPGVPAALDRLQQCGYRLGIVTRNARPCVDDFLARHPLPHEVCLTREEVARVKPDPQHLLVALQHLGLGPAEAVMVGDHHSDIECARAAGARSAGVHLTGTSAEEFAACGADASYDDVPTLVARLCLGTANGAD